MQVETGVGNKLQRGASSYRFGWEGVKTCKSVAAVSVVPSPTSTLASVEVWRLTMRRKVCGGRELVSADDESASSRSADENGNAPTQARHFLRKWWRINQSTDDRIDGSMNDSNSGPGCNTIVYKIIKLNLSSTNPETLQSRFRRDVKFTVLGRRGFY